jgi:hypothetical protein
LREDFLAVVLVEILEDVDGIVGIEFADRCCDLCVRHLLDDLEANGLVDLGQSRQVEIGAEQPDQSEALFRLDRFEEVAELRFVQPRHVLAQEKDVAVGDCCTDKRKKISTDRAVFRIYVVRRLFRAGAGAVFVLGIDHSPPLLACAAKRMAGRPWKSMMWWISGERRFLRARRIASHGPAGPQAVV